MKITCPHCGIVGSAHASMPGEKVRCPQCEKVFMLMEQKISCPHCQVVGSVGASAVGMKFRCPRCEKVFLLTSEIVAGSLITEVAKVEDEGAALSEDSGLFTVSETRRDSESVASAELESWMLPESEAESVFETEPEGAEAAAFLASEFEAEGGASVEEGTMAEVSREEEGGEKNATVLPTQVCAGCGESFHPEFMQEIDGQLYCGVCQLRSVASESRGKTSRFCGRELRGMLAAFLLLGVLAFVLFALMKLGIL